MQNERIPVIEDLRDALRNVVVQGCYLVTSTTTRIKKVIAKVCKWLPWPLSAICKWVEKFVVVIETTTHLVCDRFDASSID